MPAALSVRPHFYLEVVSYQIVKLYLDDSGGIWTDIAWVVKVVVEDDALLSIGG